MAVTETLTPDAVDYILEVEDFFEFAVVPNAELRSVAKILRTAGRSQEKRAERTARSVTKAAAKVEAAADGGKFLDLDRFPARHGNRVAVLRVPQNPF